MAQACERGVLSSDERRAELSTDAMQAEEIAASCRLQRQRVALAHEAALQGLMT
jgi:hypothetical protein